MNYTLKGKIKRFLELTFIGKEKMYQDIISEILTAQGGELTAKLWSVQNKTYKLTIDNDGYTTRYYVIRNNRTAFTFTFENNEFLAYINDTENLYRTWKELV